MARMIKGHLSRGISEIAEIMLQHGSYSFCTLPHDRYLRSKQACGKLVRAGLAEVTGKTDTSRSIKPTDLLKSWKASGSNKSPENWLKPKEPTHD